MPLMTDILPEHAALLADLHTAGFAPNSVYDWVNGSTPPAAEEILLAHLANATEPATVEGIVRALTQRGFKSAVPILVRKFGDVPEEHVRWAIANAIAYHGFRRTDWPQILKYAEDPRFGTGRQNLVAVLHRIKGPEVEALLIRLIQDPDVDAFAVMALGRCGGNRAREALQSLTLADRTPLMQREVPKAIKRIEARMGAA